MQCHNHFGTVVECTFRAAEMLSFFISRKALLLLLFVARSSTAVLVRVGIHSPQLRISRQTCFCSIWKHPSAFTRRQLTVLKGG
jgi:hypothetical protein